MKLSQCYPPLSIPGQKLDAKRAAGSQLPSSSNRLRDCLNSSQASTKNISSFLLEPNTTKSVILDTSNILANTSRTGNLNNSIVSTSNKYSVVHGARNIPRKSQSPMDSTGNSGKKLLPFVKGNCSPGNIENQNQSFCVGNKSGLQVNNGKLVRPSKSPVNTSQNKEGSGRKSLDKKAIKKEYSLTERDQCTPTSALIPQKTPAKKQETLKAKEPLEKKSEKKTSKSPVAVNNKAKIDQLKCRLSQTEEGIKKLAAEIKADHDNKYKILNELVNEGVSNKSWENDEFFLNLLKSNGPKSKPTETSKQEQTAPYKTPEDKESNDYFSFYPEKDNQKPKTSSESRRIAKDIQVAKEFLRNSEPLLHNTHLPRQIRRILS